MSTAKKEISKKRSKGMPSMGELCTQQLWHQSIAAGKAEELVDMLMECEEGKAALKKAIPAPVECIVINRINSESSFTAYLKRNEKTEFLFMLVDHYDDLVSEPHPLGGCDITWNCEDEMGDWIEEQVEKMLDNHARDFFKLTLDVDIPERDDDGEKLDPVAYLEGEGEEWNETVNEKVREILMETDDSAPQAESIIFTPKDLFNFEQNGIVKKHLVVFTICEEAF